MIIEHPDITKACKMGGINEETVVGYCKCCGGEIYDGEYYGVDDNYKYICTDCIDYEFMEMDERSKFEYMGYTCGKGVLIWTE